GGDDVLFFGAALTAADVVNGGSGSDNLVLQGNYSLSLAGSAWSSLETLSLLSGAVTTWGGTGASLYDYALTMGNGDVDAATQLLVNAGGLAAGEDLSFDGSAETDGSFQVRGGNGVDTLKGGQLADVF